VIAHAAFLLRKPGGKRADFRKLDLSGVRLSGVNLSSALFGDALVRAGEFIGCTLVGVDASFTNFEEAAFIGCDMRRIRARSASFLRANISGCDLRDGDFHAENSNETSVALNSTSFAGASFVSIDIAGRVPGRGVGGIGGDGPRAL